MIKLFVIIIDSSTFTFSGEAISNKMKKEPFHFFIHITFHITLSKPLQVSENWRNLQLTGQTRPFLSLLIECVFY